MNELTKRFTYHAVSSPAINEMQSIRGSALQLALLIANTVPEGARERAYALMKLEEVVMWANAGIAREKGNPV